MRRFYIATSIIIAAALMAGCAGTEQTDGRMFGLASGPVPEPQPFVTQSRHDTPSESYPVVGTTPSARTDRLLTQTERQALEKRLLARAGR